MSVLKDRPLLFTKILMENIVFENGLVVYTTDQVSGENVLDPPYRADERTNPRNRGL